MKSRMILKVASSLLIALFAMFMWTRVHAGQRSGSSRSDYIEGDVTGPKGPEAGVWVIAETSDLPTKYTKIVVTDDKGRYVLPQLPDANYRVWVRGYGLVDSSPIPAKPGQNVSLKTVAAPDGRTAAQIYPANYWLSLLKIPPGELPTQELELEIKGCLVCHQLGNKPTREIPEATMKLGPFKSSLEAWNRRIQSGPSGAYMDGIYKGFGTQAAMFSDWTDRVAAGEFPKEAPPRPSGVERNLVLTLWDWGTATTIMHDMMASDVRNPSVNANGPVYGAVLSHDLLLSLNPIENTISEAKIPSHEPLVPGSMYKPSPYWGEEEISESAAAPRSLAVDGRGRAWFAAKIRGQEQPSFCKAGSSNKFAKYFPLERGNKQVEFYDPKTKQFSEIDTCFTTDHDQFAQDSGNSIFFGQTGSLGWINSKIYDQTHSAEASIGWVPGVLDINGDGKITKPWTEPDQPIDPTKDHRINFNCYSVSISPADGSAWCTGIGIKDIQLVRLELGSNPPETSKAEVYEPPPGQSPIIGSGGTDVDSNGVVWINWRASGHMTSFDRRKCKVLNGSTATGQQCPEGWKSFRMPGPAFQDGTVKTDLTYLIDVDRHGVLGLGENVPIAGAANADALLAFVPQTGKWVTLRVPYPLGFFPRKSAGRIDDSKAGWKGRGVWSSNNIYAPWHVEGGKGTKNTVVKFQLRPDPLAH